MTLVFPFHHSCLFSKYNWALIFKFVTNKQQFKVKFRFIYLSERAQVRKNVILIFLLTSVDWNSGTVEICAKTEVNKTVQAQFSIFHTFFKLGCVTFL